MKYIPYGKYPKGQKSFNLIKMMPALFKGINFGDFISLLGSERVHDCWDGIIFLFSSKYQENDGAKLVMMLSAIERSNGTWKPLEVVLKNKKFKKEMYKQKTGKEACQLLEHRVDDYLDNFGSTRSIVKFFRENLTDRDKRILTGGIRRSFVYKRKTMEDGMLFTPTYGLGQESMDEELGRVLKSFIYKIRSGFVHNASYIIIPNKKYLRKSKIFEMDMYEEGLPKEHWVTILPFEILHGIFSRAFVRYWRKEYFEKKKEAALV